MTQKNRRPVFLDITRIHLPVTAVISIIHRVTGVLFFILTPLLIYLFDLSLSSLQGYDTVAGIFDHWGARLLIVILLWGFAHHFLAGIRFLLIDLDIGVSGKSSRVSAWWVTAGGLVVLFGSALVLL
jgi:succinate dehydrogenase / fumarate reductase cytochrome b subunit